MHSFRPFILSCIFLVWIFHQNHATLWSHSRRSVFNTPVFSEHLWTPKKLNNVSPHWDFFCFLLSFGKENCKAKGVFSILYLAATMHIRNLDLRNWADQMWHSLATTVCIYRQHYSQWGTDLKHKLTIYLSNSFVFGWIHLQLLFYQLWVVFKMYGCLFNALCSKSNGSFVI